LKNWVEMLKVMVKARKVLKLFAFSKGHYANVLYAGHGPATGQAFRNEHL